MACMELSQRRHRSSSCSHDPSSYSVVSCHVQCISDGGNLRLVLLSTYILPNGLQRVRYSQWRLHYTYDSASAIDGRSHGGYLYVNRKGFVEPAEELIKGICSAKNGLRDPDSHIFVGTVFGRHWPDVNAPGRQLGREMDRVPGSCGSRFRGRVATSASLTCIPMEDLY